MGFFSKLFGKKQKEEPKQEDAPVENTAAAEEAPVEEAPAAEGAVEAKTEE